MNEFKVDTTFLKRPHPGWACFIAVVILVAVWQISLFHNTLKWDAIDITFPWRYFVSDAFMNHEFPWWNPFQFHGFAHGLSLETWYPLGLLLGASRGYGLYSLNLEYIIHLLIASYGFYRFALALGLNWEGALWGAMVFPLCGFFVGNAQHTGWIASGAWIPHVLASFWQWRKFPNLKHTLSLTILTYMMVSGGYIAFSIILAYVMALIGMVDIIRSLKIGQQGRIIWLTARLLFCIISACSLLFACLWQLKEQIDRGAGLSGEAIYKGSLYFKHLVSLLYPFATVKGDFAFWSGDQSMMNLYFGLSGLILIFLSLQKVLERTYRPYWFIACASLSLALAVELPFRAWLNHIPFFDLFRFPSLFRYFTILSMVLIGSKMIGEAFRDDQVSQLFRQFRKTSAWLTGFIALTAVGLLVTRDDLSLSKLLSFSIDTVHEAAFLQSLSHLGLLTMLLLTLQQLRHSRYFYMTLLLFTGADMIVSCQLNGRVSIFSEHPFKLAQSCVDQLPVGFPLPPLDDAIGTNSDRTLQFNSIYRNTNTLYKRVGWDGYTPFQYQTFIEFEKTPYYQKSLQLPFLFVSRPVSDLVDDFYESDPLRFLDHSQFKVTSFAPNHIVANLDLEHSSTLVLNQNLVDAWQVTLDSKAAEIIPVDYALMGVRVPAGPHEIHFFYKPGQLLHAFVITAISLFLCLAFYIWINRKSSIHLLASLAIIIMCFPSFFSFNQRNLPELSSTPVLINALDEGWPDNIASSRFLDKGDLDRFEELIASHDSNFAYITRTCCLPYQDVFLMSLRERGDIRDSLLVDNYLLYYVSPREPQAILFSTHNKFETASPGWEDQGVNLKVENSNTFQSLNGRKYGTSITIDLGEIEPSAAVQISVDHRNTEPIEASVVCNLLSDLGAQLFWKSMKIPEQQAEASWQTLNWTIKLPEYPSGSSLLKVYIWNKGQTNLEIDNLSVKLLSQ